jgi:hypothetical protein
VDRAGGVQPYYRGLPGPERQDRLREFPGDHGEIRTMNRDGSKQKSLTKNSEQDVNSDWGGRPIAGTTRIARRGHRGVDAPPIFVLTREQRTAVAVQATAPEYYLFAGARIEEPMRPSQARSGRSRRAEIKIFADGVTV